MTVASMVHKLMPARQTPAVRVVADFDSLICEPVGFIFQGKTYELKPVDTETFMRIADSYGEIQGLIKAHGEKSVTTEAVYAAYMNFITPLCPQMTIKDIKHMTMPQLHGLLDLVIKHTTGQINGPELDTEKKKT